LCVSIHTTPKRAAWARVTVERDAPTGRVTRFPGTRAQNKAAAYRAINIFILPNRKKVFTIFSFGIAYQ